MKVRYKQTIFGILWVVLQPVLMTVIFTVVLGMLARVPSNNLPYPLLVYTGLLPWTFFSSAVLGSSNSLAGNAHLITKVYFPRLIIPIAAVAGRLFDFAFAFLVLVGLMVYYRVFTTQILLLPLFITLLILLALGFSILFSAINVKYRDVGVALPVLIQLWMFVSPVIYSSDLVPPKFRSVYALNPMVGIIEGFRGAILGAPVNRTALLISLLFTAVLLVASSYLFRRIERTFADVI